MVIEVGDGSMRASTEFCTPWPQATSRITAETPMTRPSMVSAERSRCGGAQSAQRDEKRFPCRCLMCRPCPFRASQAPHVYEVQYPSDVTNGQRCADNGLGRRIPLREIFNRSAHDGPGQDASARFWPAGGPAPAEPGSGLALQRRAACGHGIHPTGQYVVAGRFNFASKYHRTSRTRWPRKPGTPGRA